MSEFAAQQQRGPVGNTRSVGLSILWFVLTLSIYGFIWAYKSHEEIKRYSGNGVGGVLGLVIYILISPVTYFIVPSEIRYMYEDLDGQKSPVRGITGLWFLLPIHKPSGNSCMLSQVFRPTQSLFRLLIFQIGINDLKLTWNPSRLRFTQIQKDDGLVTSITDSQANNSLIAVTPCYENGQD